MAPTRRFSASSIGTKLLIGITGLGLFGYLLIHLAGNLVVFGGQAAFNKYAYTLEDNPALPLIELALATVFLIHIYKTIRMFAGNRQARPIAYEKKTWAHYTSRKSIASSTMIVSGLWLIAFLVIHVKAFREGWGKEYPWPAGGRDLYRQEMETFANPLLVGFYIISMVVVGSHLWHGVSSACQSLGLDDSRWTPRILLFGKIMAVFIATSFIIIALWAHFTGGRS
jgi:succinate dehydrogenase / fumarate reductase, cytochrome b subunit